MNRGQMIFETSRSFGLDDTVGSDELILMQRWCNRGIRDVLIKTRCYVDIGTLALQANVTDYRVDANILALDNVTLPDSSGSPYELEVVNMVDLLPYLGNVASTATPSVASIDGTLMRIAPAPSSAITLTYFFVPKPTEIPADGTTGSDALDPSTATYGGIAEEYHEAILAFMAWKAADYDDKTSALSAKEYRLAYEGLCKDIRKQHRRKSGRGLHGGRVGYPGSRGPSGRNDVYPDYRR